MSGPLNFDILEFEIKLPTWRLTVGFGIYLCASCSGADSEL